MNFDAEGPLHQKRADELFLKLSKGDKDAYDELFVILYEDLRRIAHRLFTRERGADTAQTGDLVARLYLELLGSKSIPWKNYRQFLITAARALRQSLMDYSRIWKRSVLGNGKGSCPHDRMDIDHLLASKAVNPFDFIQIGQAIEAIWKKDPPTAQIADLRLTLGFSLEEVSQILKTPLTGILEQWKLVKETMAERLAPAC